MEAFSKLTIIFILIISIASTTAVTRKVVSKTWPGCERYTSCQDAQENNTLPIVVYTKASTKNHDNLHFIFSTKELPTVLIARTSKLDSDIQFNWDIILALNETSLEKGITFSNNIKPDYKFGICFTQLIEYDDQHDDANLNDCTTKHDMMCQLRSFKTFSWLPLNETTVEETNSLVFNTSDDKMTPSLSLNGTLSFSFNIPGKDGRVSAQPAQKYTGNETLFEFMLDNYTPAYNQSRFALGAVVISQDKRSKMSVDTIKTIDDEYSPGVFQLTNWLTNSIDNSKSGFIQWKPVAYFGKTRGRQTSTKVDQYGLKDLDKMGKEMELLNASFLSALFGKDLFDGESEIKKMNISFGQPNDGFYVENNFTVWNGAIGYGIPPKDEVSMTLIIIISAGLGLPVLICIIGGIYTICRSVRKKNSQYEAINGDDSINHNRPQVN